MDVSVIIPVYNAAKYVEKAVESVLKQPEVKEVILIEDGSDDDSFLICQKIASSEEKVRLYRNDENKGAGPSRNLGIGKASCPYIAFLDADDWFLPQRFKNTKKIFLDREAVEAVGEVVGVHYYTKSSEIQHLQRMKAAKETALMKEIELGHTGVEILDNNFKRTLEKLLSGKYGWLHLNGLTVKKSVLDKISFPNLKIAQDVAFIYQLAYRANIYFPQDYSPVAVRGVHGSNRVLNNVEREAPIKLTHFLFEYFHNEKLNFVEKCLLTARFLDYYDVEMLDAKGAGRKTRKLWILTKLFFVKPDYVFAYVFCKNDNRI